jgi:hypothetical protein
MLTCTYEMALFLYLDTPLTSQCRELKGLIVHAQLRSLLIIAQ